jgi:hypothetical protein
MGRGGRVAHNEILLRGGIYRIGNLLPRCNIPAPSRGYFEALSFEVIQLPIEAIFLFSLGSE